MKTNPFQPPPAKEAEIIPDVRELIDDVKTRNLLAKLVTQSIDWQQTEKEAKKAREPITTQIKKILGDYEVGKAVCNGYRLNYFNSPRSSISKELLLSNGVSPAIITKCTTTSNSYTLRITAPGEEDE